MIGRLEGTVLEKSAEGVLLDVNGVGYDVQCPLTVIDKLPRKGARCALSIHTHVREDQLSLFGFAKVSERTLFRQLIGVSGIGPRTGLACLSGMDADGLIGAIANSDAKALSRIPGIGKRTAERIILELREKVGGIPGKPAARSTLLGDLESALGNLGYSTREVDKLIVSLGDEAEQMDFEGLLREALKRLRR